MVGVEVIRECSKEEMEWLKNNGRNRIERMVKRFNKKILRGHGDFWITIDLPTDILVIAYPLGGITSRVYRFDQRRKQMAKELAERLKNVPEIARVEVTTGKEYFELKDNQYHIDATWHGTYAYWKGWEYILTIVPTHLFRKGL